MGQGPRFIGEQLGEIRSVNRINHCELLCGSRRNAERLLSPTLSSVPNGGERDGGLDADGTNVCNDRYGDDEQHRWSLLLEPSLEL